MAPSASRVGKPVILGGDLEKDTPFAGKRGLIGQAFPQGVMGIVFPEDSGNVEFLELAGQGIATPAEQAGGLLLVAMGVLQRRLQHDPLELGHGIGQDIDLAQRQLAGHPLLQLLLPRFLTGIASGVIIVLGESWITGGAAGKNRATLTGIYASAFTGCQLAGPLLISAGADYQTWVLLAVIGLTAACLLMLRHLPTGTRESLGERASWRSLGAFLPVLASGVFCFAFFDASILALLPLYGMDKGLNEGLAVLLVTVVLTGDAMFQTPLGWLADRVGIRRVHLACAVVFSLSLLALPLMLGSRIQLMAICLLLGAAAGALFLDAASLDWPQPAAMSERESKRDAAKFMSFFIFRIPLL